MGVSVGGDAWSPPFFRPGDGGGSLDPAGGGGQGAREMHVSDGEVQGGSGLVEDSSAVHADLENGAVLMECNSGLHAPVHGSTREEADYGRGSADSFMQMQTPGEVSGKIFRFGSQPFLVNQGKDSGPQQVVGMPPRLFSLGSEHAAGESSARCGQGVRSFATAGKRDLVPPGAAWGGPGRTAAPSKPAWNKPVVVQLPSRAELGEGLVCEGRVQLDEEDVLTTVRRFDMALIGRTFGRRLSFEYLNTELHRRWGGLGDFRLVTVSGDCFLCFFESTECRDAVLTGGPWIVAGQVVGVDCWTPTFSPASSVGFITPIWVRLPALPMYCWGGRNIARLAARLGEPMCMDAATDRLERGHFARVCIRLDLSKPLVPGMWVDGPFGSFFQNVEYEGLSSFCFRCGHVGHKADRCNVLPSARVQPLPDSAVDGHATQVVQTMGVPVGHSKLGESGEAVPIGDPIGASAAAVQRSEDGRGSTEGFRPWMFVSRKKKLPRGQPGERLPRPRKVGDSHSRPRSGFAQSLTGAALPGPHASVKPTTGKGPWGPPLSIQADQRNGQGASADTAPSLPGGKVKGSKASAEREVKFLGPLTHGSRHRKRRLISNGDGGDASPLVDQ